MLYVVPGGKDNKVKIWQLNSGIVNVEFVEHTAPITCITFAPNGLLVVSGSEDKSVKVWSITLSLLVSTYQVKVVFFLSIIIIGITFKDAFKIDVCGSIQLRMWQSKYISAKT